MLILPPQALGGPVAFWSVDTVKYRSLIMSTISGCLSIWLPQTGCGARAWQATAFLAEVGHERDTEQGGAHARGRRQRVARADHPDAVVAADGACQSAQARRHPALQ